MTSAQRVGLGGQVLVVRQGHEHRVAAQEIDPLERFGVAGLGRRPRSFKATPFSPAQTTTLLSVDLSCHASEAKINDLELGGGGDCRRPLPPH